MIIQTVDIFIRTSDALLLLFCHHPRLAICLLLEVKHHFLLRCAAVSEHWIRFTNQPTVPFV
jgi:hypothetical protein